LPRHEGPRIVGACNRGAHMGQALELTPSSDLMGGATPSWSHCTWRLLAEGDSWFSIGALNPLTSANLLQSMEFSQFTAAAHCSYPGDTLRRMAELRSDPHFVQLLAGNVSWRWDATCSRPAATI
jgi:hypothetical protein